MLSREELKEGLKEMGHPDPSDATVSAMLEAAEMGNEQRVYTSFAILPSFL